MRLSIFLPFLMVLALTDNSAQQATPVPARAAGIRLDAISWQSAETHLKNDSVVVLPLGAGSAAHGPHLPLNTEQRLADYLTRRVLEDVDVVVAPALSYHYYPAFVEYPGSTTLTLNTARDLTADVARSLARYGPRRFYVLNTSAVSVPALDEAAKLLSRDGILLRFTDPRARLEASIRTLRQQAVGSHADEIETSMMLFVDPSLVDMSKATRELGMESKPFLLTRRQGNVRGTYSSTGVWGDATLATREKGVVFVEALLKAIRGDIDDLRRSPTPVGAGTLLSGGPSQPMGSPAMQGRPGECRPADDRTIRGIGPAFALAWANQDAIRLSGLWNANGDMVHPDGFIEGSSQTIRENRTALFMRQEYRSSRHGLYIGAIRCITPDVAIADAKWDLRGVTDGRGMTMPTVEGLSTLVLKRREAGWGIEAYRYTMKQTQSVTQPTVLNRPGFTEPIK